MDKPAVAIPPARGWTRRRTFAWALAVLLLATAVFLTLRYQTARQAAKELRAMGLQVGINDIGQQLRTNWRRLFSSDFWEYRGLVIVKNWRRASLDACASPFHRYQPRGIFLGYSGALNDVSALHGLTNLERLEFHKCPNIRDLGIVSEFKKLKELSFVNSPALGSLAIIDSKSSLKSLRVLDCPNLTKIDALREMTSLRELTLTGCPELKSCELLRGMSDLEELDLSDCAELTNIDALHGLKKLRAIKINGCKKLQPSDVAALREAFPSVLIRLPW